jgi:RNA polymerase sigma factor (sigma-70 family)
MNEPARNAWFEALLARHHDHLVWFIRGLLGDEQQAYDIAQDVFVAAWQALQRGTPPFTAERDEDGARRWLYRVAYNRAVSYLRHHRLIVWESLERLGTPEDDAFAEPVALEDRVVESEVLRAALATLPAADATCILLTVVHGFTAWEIAQVVELTPEATKKRLWRTKERLRSAYIAQQLQPASSRGQAQR